MERFTIISSTVLLFLCSFPITVFDFIRAKIPYVAMCGFRDPNWEEWEGSSPNLKCFASEASLFVNRPRLGLERGFLSRETIATISDQAS